jgi:hypothetical protein
MSLILVGTGLKLILEHDPNDSMPELYSWLISGALAVFYAAVLISQSSHHGIHEEYFALSPKDRRYGFPAQILL